MLEVKNLSAGYKKDGSLIMAVNGVGFSLKEGEILGLVGESGSGKSTIALAIMKLIEQASGEVLFRGRNLLSLNDEEIRLVRGKEISMIFQDPFTSLNPVLTVGEQIAEVIRFHQGLNRKEAWQRSIEVLDLVRIKEPEKRITDYPHQFSGGMRQRVMIAMALAAYPKLLLADEPTTALDVTIQLEILELLKELRQELKLSILFITHNFGIVKYLCDRVVVLHQGVVVESGEVGRVLSEPKDEYTKRLIECLKLLN